LEKRNSVRPEPDSLSIAVAAGRTQGTKKGVGDWFTLGTLFGLPIGFGLPYILDNQSHDPPARTAFGATLAVGVAIVAAPFFVERASIPDSLAWIRSNEQFAEGYQRAYKSRLGLRRQVAGLIGSAAGTAAGFVIFYSLLHIAYAGE
jgi:hypothetical protein